MKNKDLTPATMKDIKDDRREFYFYERGNLMTLTRMMPEEYPNFGGIDEKEKTKFIQSCRTDWTFKTDIAKELLKNENLFINGKV